MIKFFLSLLVCFFSISGVAQTLNDYRDCVGAVWSCGIFSFPHAVTGEGNITNEVNITFSCLNSGERNGLWLKVKVSSPGTFGFNIIPAASQEDYDWAVFKMDGHDCSEIVSDNSLEIECNFSGGTFPTPVTGMNNGQNSQDEPMVNAEVGDVYYLLVNNFTGGADQGFVVDFTIGTCGFFNCANVSGNVFVDSNGDCIRNENEQGVPNAIVNLTPLNAEGESYATITDSQGAYAVLVLDQGEFEVTYDNASGLLASTCSPVIAAVDTTDENNYIADLPLTTLLECSVIRVENSAGDMRLCDVNHRIISVCNDGTIESPPFALMLTYDPNIFPVTSTLPFTVLGDNLYVFEIGSIPMFDCITISITDSAKCIAQLMGTTGCVAAHSSFETDCPTADYELLVSDTCTETGYRVEIRNIGSETVNPPASLIVFNYLNSQVQQSTQTINLGSGQSGIFEYPDDGSIYSSNLLYNYSQNINLPLNYCSQQESQQVVFSTDNSQSIDCGIFVNGYDPNDKTGFPQGVGEENYIHRYQDLRYRIRFQNTGNAEAFKVVIRDTLPSELDEFSLIPGASSHEYLFQRSAGKLEFSFYNINLPDSASDPEGSQGFVEYYVRQKTTNPESFTIANRAGIYFDFNEPVITNTHIYTIAPVSVGINDHVSKKKSLLLYPNPAGSLFFVRTPEDLLADALEIVDHAGKVIIRKNNFVSGSSINSQGLVNGIYIVRLIHNHSVVAADLISIIH